MTISKPIKLTEVGLPNYQIEASRPGMAHFAGTGPSDQTCGSCGYWQAIPRSGKQHCAKYVEMTGDRKLKQVPSRTWACRWWVKR